MCFRIKAHQIQNHFSISVTARTKCLMGMIESCKKVKKKSEGLFESIPRTVSIFNPSVAAAHTDVHIQFASKILSEHQWTQHCSSG